MIRMLRRVVCFLYLFDCFREAERLHQYICILPREGCVIREETWRKSDGHHQLGLAVTNIKLLYSGANIMRLRQKKHHLTQVHLSHAISSGGGDTPGEFAFRKVCGRERRRNRKKPTSKWGNLLRFFKTPSLNILGIQS